MRVSSPVQSNHGLAGTGTFATDICGNLRLRFAVLSVQRACDGSIQQPLSLNHMSPCQTCIVFVYFDQDSNLDPEVLQSGFGLNSLFWSGEFWENCRRISQRILPANLSRECFGLVSPELQTPPKNHGQKLSAFLSRLTFLNPLFWSHRCSAYGGHQKTVKHKMRIAIRSGSSRSPSHKKGKWCKHSLK